MVYRLGQEASLGGKKNRNILKSTQQRNTATHQVFVFIHCLLPRDLAVSEIQMFLFLISFRLQHELPLSIEVNGKNQIFLLRS